MNGDAEETWLKLGDAHRMLGPLNITAQTVRNWADTGRLKSMRLGQDGASGHRRVALSSVLAELARRGITPRSEDSPTE